MYILDIYIKEIGKLQVITYERKYINIVNSYNFFFSEIEEMKSCKYRVETANAGMGLYWFWHHLFILLLEETVLFTTKTVCKVQYLTIVCNHYPMLTMQSSSAYCWVAYLYWPKCHCQELEKSQSEKSHGTNISVWLIAGEKQYTFQMFFLTTPNLSVATGDYRSPNTISSVKCSTGKKS